MKKITKGFQACLALYIIMLSVSCKKDFLRENPTSFYTPQTLNDSLGVNAALVGLYNQTSTYFSVSDQQGWPSVWQVGTDVANATNNQQGVEIPYYDYTKLTPTDGAAATMWRISYKMINTTNFIINSIDNNVINNIGPTGKTLATAEAKFFRAYAYNYLTTLFGAVPLVDKYTQTPRTDYTRTPLADVNNFIVNDLIYAATNLPDIEAVKTVSNNKLYGRANKYMAMQLLAEVYLRMGKNDLAEQQAQAIINSGQFSLMSNRFGVKSLQPGDAFADIFISGNQRRVQGNREVIWTLEQENPNVVIGGITNSPQQRRVWTTGYYAIQGMVLADSLGGRGLSRLRVSNWFLYRLYQPNDIRNSKYNVRRKFFYNDPKSPNFGKQVPYTGPDTLFKINPSITKWNQFDPNDPFGFAMIKDFILMRLGETYLLLAEAQFKQGKLQDAANAINVLRQRAFPNYPTEGQVQASDITLDFILDERARELIGEENRRMTLMRTGTLVDRATRLNSNDAAKPLAGISQKNLLLPIPLNEIQLNKDGNLAQNPGY